MVTRYRILEQPNEHGQAVEAVKHRWQIFGRALRLVAGDHGVHSLETEGVLTAAGVKLVAIPAVGKVSAERQALQQSRKWKRGYRWCAGIASLRRDFDWRRAYRGLDGMERWPGLGVIESLLRRRSALTKRG